MQEEKNLLIKDICAKLPYEVKIMTQEDKNLLIKDLCARLPYEVKVQIKSRDTKNKIVYLTEENISHLTNDWWNECKPYLFPLSSMTNEQKKEFDQCIELELKAINDEIDPTYATAFEVDFYNKHHFDWRGLIPLGLAIDATELNIY